jgi:hypothetical protein
MPSDDDDKSKLADARTAAKDSNADFQEAHQRGMQALKDKDYKSLEDAIEDESAAIDKMQKAIEVVKPDR